MWKGLGMILTVLLLCGCQQRTIEEIFTVTHTEIDWVDFIRWDGEEYLNIHTGVLADESYLGEKLGEVQFKVADNVSNPSYRTKDGDAAFHEPGTELYSIKGEDKLLAVQSDNGYQVYYVNNEEDYKWHFKDLPLDKVNKVKVYLDAQLINEVEDVKKFLQILSNGVLDATFQPNTNYRDPIYYEMVFYAEGPVAYKYMLAFDGKTYYWHPWDTEILSEEIVEYLEEV